MSTLKDTFTSMGLKPTITLKMLQDLDRFVKQYEVKPNNVEAFNTPLLGVTKAFWLPADTETVFSIFNIDRRTMVNAIKQCPDINQRFHVTSNEFNILIIWLIHCLRHSTGFNPKQVYDGSMNLLKTIMYHFFTGKVSSLFPYAAKSSVMSYTLDNLTAKSDIKNPETDTWKKLIYKHCESTLEPNGIYTNVFNNFAPDLAIAKAISDIHTRLCRKIVLIAEAYYENNKNGSAYSSSTLMMTNNEGEQALGDLQGTLDISISRICTAVLNYNEFVDMNLVNLAAKLASNIRKDNVLDVLNLFSRIATQQVRDKETQLVKMDKNKEPLYVGYTTLIQELVQKTYRRAAMSGIDTKSNVAILQVAKNTYTSSRVLDKDVMIVKNSIDYFLQQTKYTRQGTLVSLRLAFILYILLLSFKMH